MNVYAHIRKQQTSSARRLELGGDEWAAVRRNMARLNALNFADYARKMLVDGYVVVQDFTALKELTRELGGIGRNVNQLVRRANETRSIHADDVADLQRYFGEIRRRVSEQLVKIPKRDE